MVYRIDQKLVVGVSTNALFDLRIEDEIFNSEGIEKYKAYQKENRDSILEKGLAYPFVRRFLNINKLFPDQQPVEVVLLSKNSPETGLRVFNSIQHYGLDISRAAFTSGRSPFSYIPAFNISLFLSTNKEDVYNAIHHNHPAGLILNTNIHDDESDPELRIAFDFDGVLVDDSAEKVYQKKHDLNEFHDHEVIHSSEPISPGLMHPFFQKLSYFQKLENENSKSDPHYKKVLRTAIITARNAPSHKRAINTLETWDVDVDEMFFLGGIEKRNILEVLKPHLFIDDQIGHLDQSLEDIPLVHIPFGMINNEKQKVVE